MSGVGRSVVSPSEFEVHQGVRCEVHQQAIDTGVERFESDVQRLESTPPWLCAVWFVSAAGSAFRGMYLQKWGAVHHASFRFVS